MGSLISLSLLNANSDISLFSGLKDYKNSKTKVDGKVYKVGTSHTYNSSKVSFNYSKDSVNREHFMTKRSIEQLNVKKYNLNYNYNINDKLTLKTNYIKIIDNLAPTDQGKVYGIGLNYKLSKSFDIDSKYYRSDYENFNVNQFDLKLSKKIKLKDFKSKISIITKKIAIDGDKYGQYTLKDKSYFTTGVNFSTNYHGYVGSVGTFFGKRLFSVLNEGQVVQHHAMEQEKTHIISFGRKFKSFDIIAKYTYQKGNELPENQNNVDTKITSLMLKYKF